MPDWRVIPAGYEGCRKELSSKRIGALGTVDRLVGAAGKPLYSFHSDSSTYHGDTALDQCGEAFECDSHVGWFRVECGKAAYTLVLLYMSISVRESQ